MSDQHPTQSKLHRCGGTGKVRFPNRKAAQERLEEINRMPGGDFYMPNAVTQRCRSCDGFHLTSSPVTKRWGSGKRTRGRRSSKRS